MCSRISMHFPSHCLNPLLPSEKIIDYNLRNCNQSYVLTRCKLNVLSIRLLIGAFFPLCSSMNYHLYVCFMHFCCVILIKYDDMSAWQWITTWPLLLTFWPQGQCMPSSCHKLYVYRLLKWLFQLFSFYSMDRQKDRQTVNNAAVQCSPYRSYWLINKMGWNRNGYKFCRV